MSVNTSICFADTLNRPQFDNQADKLHTWEKANEVLHRLTQGSFKGLPPEIIRGKITVYPEETWSMKPFILLYELNLGIWSDEYKTKIITMVKERLDKFYEDPKLAPPLGWLYSWNNVKTTNP